MYVVFFGVFSSFYFLLIAKRKWPDMIRRVVYQDQIGFEMRINISVLGLSDILFVTFILIKAYGQ